MSDDEDRGNVRFCFVENEKSVSITPNVGKVLRLVSTHSQTSTAASLLERASLVFSTPHPPPPRSSPPFPSPPPLLLQNAARVLNPLPPSACVLENKKNQQQTKVDPTFISLRLLRCNLSCAWPLLLSYRRRLLRAVVQPPPPPPPPIAASSSVVFRIILTIFSVPVAALPSPSSQPCRPLAVPPA